MIHKKTLGDNHFRFFVPFSICPGSILLANCFRNFGEKNDSQENFVRHSLANIAKVVRITNLTKF